MVGRKVENHFDNGELYDQLMNEIITINNVAISSAGMLPDHLQTRLEKSSRSALRIMKGKK